MNNIEWFREAKYGMMVHFGLYSMLAGECKGRRTPYDYGEWIQSAFAIPNREMEQLAGAFNPVYFNAEEWVKLAKECGMTYFVVTSKHHEGFALFDSDCDAYNIKKATPFGRDLIAELAEACYKHGLKLGLYYSQDLLVHTYKTEIFHRGLPAFWKSMPLKIKTWGCYLPLLCHIATPQQAQRMVREYFQSALCSDYGIRTVAKDEKMYDLTPSGNPSNWLGAIWTVSNYALFRGFLDYGFAEEALTIKNQTLAYLARDIETHGSMSESYHPDTGEGILHHNFFSWNCLAASMIRESKNI